MKISRKNETIYISDSSLLNALCVNIETKELGMLSIYGYLTIVSKSEKPDYNIALDSEEEIEYIKGYLDRLFESKNTKVVGNDSSGWIGNFEIGDIWKTRNGMRIFIKNILKNENLMVGYNELNSKEIYYFKYLNGTQITGSLGSDFDLVEFIEKSSV